MATVFQIIQRLLPSGTELPAADGKPVSVRWSSAPVWPPDLFAVTATLVNLSGCYSHAVVMSQAHGNYAERVREIATYWSEPDDEGEEEQARRRVQELWATLLLHGHSEVAYPLPVNIPPWCLAAVELMAIADEAGAGLGFSGAPPEYQDFVQSRQIFDDEEDERRRDLEQQAEHRRLTSTLCILVPPEEACVQPKARTPDVGSTLRCLSLHLALLPPCGEVTTRLHVRKKPVARENLNLLVVPFPFRVRSDIFTFDATAPSEGWGRFSLNQTWLPDGRNDDDKAARVGDFLIALIDEAQKNDGPTVHGLLLPEQALSLEVAKGASDRVAAKYPHFELFVSGVLTPAQTDPHQTLPGNSVFVRLYDDGARVGSWFQPKHHRWRLTKGQLATYDIDPPKAHADLVWWEHIDIANRQVDFGQLTEASLFASLVCEDLARMDPVHPILRAVGPNLLFAVLFDGPQLSPRWAARAATGLADDPGTSVLVVTSMAPAIRWWNYRQPDATKRPPGGIQVGIWKSASREEGLMLEADDHALLLKLALTKRTERTLDRRDDVGEARQIELVDKPLAVRLQPAEKAPFDWL